MGPALFPLRAETGTRLALRRSVARLVDDDALEVDRPRLRAASPPAAGAGRGRNPPALIATMYRGYRMPPSKADAQKARDRILSSEKPDATPGIWNIAESAYVTLLIDSRHVGWHMSNWPVSAGFE